MSDYLPKDVLIEVLIRLPVKNLLQCTCVSKSWYGIITNPSFISTHLNRNVTHSNNTENHLLFVRHYDMFHKKERYALHFDNDKFDECMEFECPVKSKNEFFRIVGYCNGLICLSDVYDSYTDTVILWNPIVRRYVSLPKPKLAFCGNGLCLLGFGYDSRVNDYKVVRIVYNSNRPKNIKLEIPFSLEVLTNAEEDFSYKVPPEVEVYTHSTGTWRILLDAAAVPSCVAYNTCSGSPAFVNGALHWVASNDRGKSCYHILIVAFYVVEEVFREIMIPDSVTEKNIIKLSVMAFGTSLALIVYEKFWQSDYCWIWVMNNYGDVKSWTKKLTIDLRGGFRNVMGFRKNGDILLSARVVGMVSVDPQSKQLTYLGIHGTNRSFYAKNYVGSLALLERTNRVSEAMNSSNVVVNGETHVLPSGGERVEEEN